MDEAEKKPASLLEQAKACFKQAEDLWKDNRKRYLAAVKFRLPGGQWPEKLKAEREALNLPCLEVDKLNQYVRQVVNDGRQNRPGVKVRPEDDGGDVKVADAYQGMIRRICSRSNLGEALDTALDHAATGGFGFFRVLTQHAHGKTLNQEIVIRRVRNPLSAMLGPHYLADGSDAGFGFVWEDIPKATFTREHPKAKVTSWESEGFKDDWTTANTVRVCEFFYKEPYTYKLHGLSDGTYATDEELQAKLAAGLAVVRSEEVEGERVKWCRLTGAEVIEEKEWKGKFIPIIPVYGNEFDVEGKVILSGLIESAMDPQRLHNYMRSKFAERVALAPMAPWTAAEESIAGHEDTWKQANSGKHAVLPYRAYNDAGQQLPSPQRVNPSDIPAGFAEDMQMSEHDIRASMGMHKASLGEESNEKSGKAILARQREGDVGTFHYQDNLNRAINYLGRILVDLIPEVNDTRRSVKLEAEDGTLTDAIIDPKLETPSAKGSDGRMIYNLKKGSYGVAVEAGPSYTTKRQEAAEAQMQLVQAIPEVFKVAGDLMVRNMDWPGAEEIADRLKALLPPELQQENEDDPPEVAAVKVQAKRMLDQVSQELEETRKIAEQMQQELQAEKAKNDAAMLKAQTDMVNAETERARMEYEAAKPPEDNTVELARLDLERERLAKEDEWKQLDAAVSVIVATIGANKAAEGAEPGAEPNEEPDEPEPPDIISDTAAAEFSTALNPTPPPGGFFTPGA